MVALDGSRAPRLSIASWGRREKEEKGEMEKRMKAKEENGEAEADQRGMKEDKT